MDTWDMILLLFGIAFIAVGIKARGDITHSRQRTAVTRGTVIGHEQETIAGGFRAGSQTMTEHAIIEYQIAGRRYQCISSTGASWKIHQQGENVEVCYDPTNPENADVTPGPFSLFMDGLMLWALPIAGVFMLGTFLIRLTY